MSTKVTTTMAQRRTQRRSSPLRLATLLFIGLASAVGFAACDGASGGGARPFVCWTSGDRCDCKPDATVPGDGTKVDNCSTELFDYCCQYSDRCGCDDNPGCGEGGVDVSSCENDYQPVDPETCPGRGHVVCSSSSECPCGMTCEQIASSSGDRACTTTCFEDSDCGSFPGWSFSSLGCNPATGVCVP